MNQYLRTEPVTSKNLRIDREAGIIRGVAIMKEGPTHDDRYTIDGTTLAQTRAFIAERGDQGMKSRFTHPNLSNDGLGRRIGAVMNPRIDGDTLRGDFHKSQLAANRAGAAEMIETVFDQAEESPEDFGMSIAYREDEQAMKRDGDALNKNTKRGDPIAPPPLRLTGVRAVDVVDEPASTDGFFSESPGDLPDGPARQATAVLDRYFGGLSSDEVKDRTAAFLERYLANRVVTEPKTKEPTMSTDPKKTDPQDPTDPASVTTEPVTPKPADPTATATTTPVATTPEPVTPATPEPVAAVKPEQVGALSLADIQAMVKKQVAEERVADKKLSRDVVALCNSAGFPEMADEFLAAELSEQDVKVALFDKHLAKAATPAVGTDPSGDVATPEKKFLAEAHANAQTLAEFGCSPEEYARSCAAGQSGEVPVFKKPEPVAA